ncbi:MAG: TraB/GumN family protein [Proteobacteria bacterium]|nr:TraB/GumN family protein [Pseudomonadota bacterium]
MKFFSGIWLSLLLAGYPALAAENGHPVSMWQIEGTSNSIYLLGSIHMLREQDHPIPSVIYAAYREAETLIMELDMDDIDPVAEQALATELGLIQDGRTLRDLMGPERYAEAESLAAELQIPLRLLDKSEPWYAAVNIEIMMLMRIGFNPMHGIEFHLSELAKRDHKEIFGTTKGLLEQFGPERCLDTPLAEEAMTGFGLGAAINGMRPIHIHIRVDFLLLAMNQLVNMVSSYSYSTMGKIKVPIVIRAVVGRGWGQGYQHSKSMHSYFSHIPGLKVIVPTTPADAKGLLISAIRDDNPVIMLEHRWLHWVEDEVPEEPYEIPIGESNILRKGDDFTRRERQVRPLEDLDPRAALDEGPRNFRQDQERPRSRHFGTRTGATD